METILEEVKKYDDVTLREKLKECGIPVGPITQGTKSLFQKRLALRQYEQKTGTKYTESDSTANQANHTQSSSEKKPSDGDSRQTDVFYAVCLPENAEPEESQEVTQLVFSDKDLALKTAKKVKGSRFKVFKCETEAQQFSKLTSESAFQSPKKLPKEEVQVSTESSPYRGPKPQDVVVLRRAIEKGDVEEFKEVVWRNPRYLVSSGDTPVMFQEGPRYTAMHIAALKNKPEMCRVILDTLEDPEFVSKLYCNSINTEETQNSRINFLVDLYLNMPDKGNCESPLHQACKFGHDAVVEVLAAHPKTDRSLLNKWGDSPKDLICSRTPNSPATLKKKIDDLLKGQCYVPLIRSEDNSAPPMIGKPWSPDVSKSPLDMPKVSWSPKDPNMSIKACAGPMSPDDATKFHKRWTTPPSNALQAKGYFNAKRSDSEKGFERIGRKLAHEMQLPWKEYWEFLQEFADISSFEGLDVLEEYFSKRKWIMFIRDFKDKFGIHEATADLEDVCTPVAKRSMERDVENSPLPVFDLDKKLDEKDQVDKRNEKDVVPSKDEVDNFVVSPMTGLSQSFAQLKLDDSWSDHATIDTDTTQNSEVVEEEVEENKQESENIIDSESKIENKLTVNNNVIQDIAEVSDVEQKQVPDEVSKILTEKQDGIDCENAAVVEDKKKAITGNSNANSIIAGDDEGKDKTADSGRSPESETCSDIQNKPPFKRLLSEGSESVSSYETAVEEAQDSSLSYISESSEGAEIPVCINLKDRSVFNKIGKFLHDREKATMRGSFSSYTVKLVLRLIPVTPDVGMTVDVVSIPEMETVNDMLLLENVEVSSCIGEISSVLDGEEVELGVEGGASEEDQASVIHAYLTRSKTLPKFGYIHGPQPTREDLDVCRALSDCLITPASHPNVFSWKLSMAKFVKDNNYKWQSPAKLKSSLKQGSPLALTARGTSPVISYGSPLGLSRPSGRDNVNTDIRTRLFPSILE